MIFLKYIKVKFDGIIYWFKQIPYKFIYFPILIIELFILFMPIIFKWSAWVYFIYITLIIIVYLFFVLKNNIFLKDSVGNGIIYGGRGKGKGILMQKKANSFKKYFSNVPMGGKHLPFNLKEYISSVGNNTIERIINGDIDVVEKIEKFEGVNILFDDVTLYTPNFVDKLLKEQYPQMPVTLAVNRHLYNHYMIIAVQDADRPYKILRELQTDFSIKALKTNGFGKIWSSIPILRNFVSVKYRFYEEIRARDEGVLPFKAIGAINEVGKTAYLTSGQATKETHLAKYGRVYHGRIFISKKSIDYDTRYFHEMFFGKKAPNS